MILISVSDYNQFSQDFYDSLIAGLQFHRLTCSCGHSACLSVHAYYTRGILLPDGLHHLRVCRVRCSECGRTHAILPSSLVPYDRISLPDQYTVVCAYEDGSDRNAVCEQNPSIDENNVKSIIRDTRASGVSGFCPNRSALRRSHPLSAAAFRFIPCSSCRYGELRPGFFHLPHSITRQSRFLLL